MFKKVLLNIDHVLFILTGEYFFYREDFCLSLAKYFEVILSAFVINMVSIPAVFFRLFRQLKVQQRYLKLELMPLVNQMMETGDDSLNKDDSRKIQKYYGLAVPAILGEAYAALRQKPLLKNERRATTYLGATTGLYDDFFDNTTLTDQYISMLYQFPEIWTGQNTSEKLFNLCWKEALAGCRNNTLIKDCAEKVHEAQIQSRLQKNGILDSNDLLKITRDKGGFSLLFYLSVFYDSFPENDKNLFYNVGALLQLENDLFDVYKDYRDDISTLVTRASSIHNLRKLYSLMWQEVKSALSATLFTSNGKKHFLQMMGVLVSRGFVCLDMLAEREKQHNGEFNPAAFSRKELICDMEKPRNILSSMRYYALLI